MFERIHEQSDILSNGKLMLLVDCKPGCYILTDLEYSEHALRELLIGTHKAIQQAIAAKDDLPLGSYVDLLTSLTNNLTAITTSLLAVKAHSQPDNAASSTLLAKSFKKTSIEYTTNKLLHSSPM